MAVLGLAITTSALLLPEFARDVRVVGPPDAMNPELERALRVRDFIDLAALMVRDARARDESCGAHFRVEHQSDGEARRDDARFAHVSAWEHADPPVHHAEALSFTLSQPRVRSYA